MTLLLVTSDQIGLTVTYEMRNTNNRNRPRIRPQKESTLKIKLCISSPAQWPYKWIFLPVYFIHHWVDMQIIYFVRPVHLVLATQ